MGKLSLLTGYYKERFLGCCPDHGFVVCKIAYIEHKVMSENVLVRDR